MGVLHQKNQAALSNCVRDMPLVDCSRMGVCTPTSPANLEPYSMRHDARAELLMLRCDMAPRRESRQQAVVLAGPVHKQARQHTAVRSSPAAAAGLPHRMFQSLSQLRPRSCQHRAVACGAPDSGLTLGGH